MIYVRGWCSHSNLLYACVIIADWARVNAASCASASIVMAKKVTTRRDEMRRTTLGVIRAPLRVHCVVTRLLLAHAAILYVTRLSNKTAINSRLPTPSVHAAHAHISFDVSRLYTPPTVMDSW